MYHSITFYTGTIKLNTYDDWHLVPETRPLVTPPTQKTKYLDIPGANGTCPIASRGIPCSTIEKANGLSMY